MQTLFYDDHLSTALLTDGRPSIFLAGPTSADYRTRWRLEALRLLEDRGFSGMVIIPEFRDRLFCEAAADRFADDDCPVPGMRPASYNILDWETTGIEGVRCVMFWMPFATAGRDASDSLPGFTTRAEVSRELVRAPHRIVLGMPLGAFSSGHIRYHAHRSGVPIYETLKATVNAALVHLV